MARVYCRLPEALERAMAEGAPYVILEGRPFASGRCSEPATSVKGEVIDAWYCGKAHRHGGNAQAVCCPDGLPLWTGPAEPGSVHDITAVRIHALLTQRWAVLQHITDDPRDPAKSHL
jgi:DDE superfamily endonuclease